MSSSAPDLPQALLKRNPALTADQFSEHWYKNHAPLAVPMFLNKGVNYYAQVHGPLKTQDASLAPEITTWDGGAETHVSPDLMAALTNPSEHPKWVMDYYREVVLVDEKRFLVSVATEHLKGVGPGLVRGERKVIIENGKCVIDVPESVWKVWKEYEERGTA